MTTLAKQTIDLVQMLDENDLITINNLLKSLVKSWDPEFVRVTKSEAARLKKIEKEMESGEYFTEDEVWQ